MNYLQSATAVDILFGPFVDKTDGVTLETGLISALDHASTGIMLSKNGGPLAVRHATVTATTYDAHGCYKVRLDATDTDTAGLLRVIYTDASTCLPVWRDFAIVSSTFQAFARTTSAIDVNITNWLGSPVNADTAGYPKVTIKSGAGTGEIATSGGAVSNVTTVGTTTTATNVTTVNGLAAGVITATSIAADAITAAKIANGAIDAATFAAGAIDATAIAADAITAAKIADGAIDAATFATGAINAAAVAADAITAAKIASDVALEIYPATLINTTIATLTNQTIFTLTAGSSDNGAYSGCVAVITDSVTATQKAVGHIFGYTGATKSIILQADPGVFTMAVGDFVAIIADKSLKPSTPNRTLDVTATGGAGIDWSNVEAPTTTLALTGTTISTSQVVASVTGAVGSVTGSVASVTGNVGGNVTGSVGSVVGNVGGNVTGSVGSVTGLTASDVGAIKTKTDQLVFTGTNRVDANVEAVNNNTEAADDLQFAAVTMVRGTASGVPTTTTIPASDLSSTVNDHYKGRSLIFTSGVLADQATSISAYNGATKTLTVVAITSAPAAGTTFVIV